jgi:nucleoid-associated protein EbfC
MAMFSKLKQIKDLRQQAKEVQSQLEEIKGEGEAEHGQIKITVNGNQKIEHIELNPDILKPENKDSIQNGIVHAHGKAMKQIQKVMAEQMRKGNIDMPDLGSLR